MTATITPALLDRQCQAIANALNQHYPHNTWMVQPDPTTFFTGGYGFIVLTRDWQAPVQTTDFNAQSVILTTSVEPVGQGGLQVIVARPLITDIMEDPNDAIFRLISCLVAAFASNPGIRKAGPVDPTQDEIDAAQFRQF